MRRSRSLQAVAPWGGAGHVTREAPPFYARAMGPRPRWIVAPLALVLAVGLVRCNVFRSVESCGADGDCDPGFLCEPTVRRCMPRADAAPPSDVAPRPDAPADDVTVPDAAVACETLPWNEPSPVRGLEGEPIISARLGPDEKTMFISRGVPPTETDIYTVVRDDVRAPFRVAGPLPVVNEPLSSEFWPTISADGKLLFFESSRSRVPDEAGVYTSESARIWSATRVNPAADFERPRLQALFDLEGPEAAPYLHPSGRTLYFSSALRAGKGQLDVWVAEIDSVGVVTDIRNVEGVNSATDENAPVVTLDERFLYHNRLAPSLAENDIYVARRTTPQDGFGKSVLVPELSSTDDEYPSWVSNDHCRIYFASSRPMPGAPPQDGGLPVFHLWVAERRR